MKTPIYDFVQGYAQSDHLRLHMPGHKGSAFLGMESLDITEIPGADSLYDASGIIAESEKNAGTLFGCRTFYSTEGSSHCLRAMLYLALLHAKHTGARPLIAACRNVHKAFITTAALLDFQVMWLYSQNPDNYLHCELTAEDLENTLVQAAEKPVAVYLTSPDYLGNLADIAGIAQVCRKHHILLLVDNAHGAYLKFLTPSLHPMDLGADLCCDSAHKTLPVLTGGAYLHIAHHAPDALAQQAKNALALFGSTSPSYLTLQSLDLANRYLETYSQRLSAFIPKANELKRQLISHGYRLYGDEPLKITLSTKACGYTGNALADLLQQQRLYCEFADQDYLVLMITPEIGDDGLARLLSVLNSFPMRSPIATKPPVFRQRAACLSIRDAMMSDSVVVPVCRSAGRVLADCSVSCPPAVPVLVCGEQIDQNAIDCFRYYGIENVSVVSAELL